MLKVLKEIAEKAMIAKIKDIYESHIDLATGKVYERELVAADRVKDYLKYSDRAGNEMIDDAVQLAQVRYFQKLKIVYQHAIFKSIGKDLGGLWQIVYLLRD